MSNRRFKFRIRHGVPGMWVSDVAVVIEAANVGAAYNQVRNDPAYKGARIDAVTMRFRLPIPYGEVRSTQKNPRD